MLPWPHMNTDSQAPGVEPFFLEDDAPAAEAKAAFLASFADAEAGGLAALQAPAPVHVIPEPAELPEAPAAPAVTPFLNVLPAGLTAFPYQYVTPYHYPLSTYNYHLPHLGLPAFGLHNLPYAGLPLAPIAVAAEPATME